MRRGRGLWLVICVWMWTVLACPGQRQDRLALDMPMPPPSHVLDLGRVFDRSPEQLEETSAMLRALEDRHGIPVYLVVYAGLLRGSVTDRAKEFFDTWVGVDRDGLVLVCDGDVRELDVALPMPGPGGGEGAMLVSRLPDEKMVPITRELQQMLDGREDLADSLVEMTRHLSTRLDGLLSVPESDAVDRDSWMIVGITLSVAGLLLLVGWLLSRRLRGAEERAREQFFFPDVLVGVRLGAQCGGGRVAVKQYGKSGS